MTDNEPGLDSRTCTTGNPARNALAATWPIGRKATARNRTEINVMNTPQGHRKLISAWYPQRPLHALCLIDTANFSLTARFSNGTESPHSAPFAFTKPSGTVDPLQAAVTANPTNGTAPLAVTFNGSTSTGNITSYQWDFGDGSTGTGATPSHTYTTAGSHTAKLTVSNASNQTSVATTVVTVTAPINTTPPTAVLSASTNGGVAPLAVTFNGSGSTAASGNSIASYTWSFGDGSTASGSTASHSFTTAGTYSTTLTVTDNRGLTSTASKTTTVTAPIVLIPPTAVVSSSTAAGSEPLAVTFNGSGSTAASGSTIASYAWSFGDGTTATGASASHSFTSAGTYTTTLTVTDNQQFPISRYALLLGGMGNRLS